MVEVKSESVAQDQQGDERVTSGEERDVKRPKLSHEEQTAVDADDQIAKQIDYYFSDVNLIRDKFMQEQLQKNDNCVKLSVLATFSRLAQLTKDEDRMIKALKNYISDNMELDEEHKQIRRTKPLPDKEALLSSMNRRTVHLSGFPDTTPFEPLQKFCSQFGEVESLMMRRHFKSRQFKGCIHVCFKNEADTEKVLEAESLMFKDRELRRESMEQYHARKEKMRQSRKKSGDRRNTRGKEEDETKGEDSKAAPADAAQVEQPKKEPATGASAAAAAT